MQKNILGSVIRDIRKTKKITQVKLSEKTGFSQNTISNHENGNRSLNESDINIYATAFDLLPEQLFEAYNIQSSIDPAIISEISSTLKELDASNQLKTLSYVKKLHSKQNKDKKSVN